MILICIILLVLYFKLTREGLTPWQTIARARARANARAQANAQAQANARARANARAVSLFRAKIKSDAEKVLAAAAAKKAADEAAAEAWKNRPCEKNEVGCIETVINPQRAMVYNISYTPPYDRYSNMSIDGSYNKSYYEENTFDVDIPLVQSNLKNVYPMSASYMYCNWELGKPSCVFRTRNISQAEHNARIGDWLNEKQLPAKQEAISKLYAERKKKSDDLALLENNTKKYMESI